MSSQCKETTILTTADDCDGVTDNTRLIFQIVNFVIITQIINIFGTASNIVNIVCFVKQGLRDPVNISLLGLTVSDLISLVTLMWLGIAVNPWVRDSDIPFNFQNTAYLTAAIPHVGCTRVTCWVTAFIALERCLCVALPVKIKRLFTVKSVTTNVIVIYIIMFFAYIAPAYYSTRLTMKPHPRKPNTTWLVLTFSEDRQIVEKYSLPINNCVVPFTAFIVITVSTVVLVVKLKSKTKWRKQITAPGTSDSISRRDKSVTKMVVLISTMFIVCYTPVCLIFIGIIAVSKECSDCIFGNLNTIIFSFAYILESINASFNIFIYYKVSSRYRQTLRQTFLLHSSRSSGSGY